MTKIKKMFLYLVVLGGSVNRANIELHDVRWVVGTKIEDTFDTLRKEWFGLVEGLHIDSYKKIKYVDGFRIDLKNFEKNNKNNTLDDSNVHQRNLWFVNIGAYSPSSMQEKHEFGLVVASNKLEAKNIATSKWLIGYKKKHKDDIACLKKLINCDDCQLIKKIGNWEIELIPENNLEIDNHSPDWYGYKRIDMI